MVNQRCSVLNCPTRAKDRVTFYCFPKNPKKKVVWIAFCKRAEKEEFVPNAASRICAKHFTPDDFMQNIDPRGRRRLKDGVVPTVDFPGNVTSVVEHDEQLLNMSVHHVVPLPTDQTALEVNGGGVVGVNGNARVAKLEPAAKTAAGDDSLEVIPNRPKITKKKLDKLPPDPEVDANTISLEDRDYYLSFGKDSAVAETKHKSDAKYMNVVSDAETKLQVDDKMRSDVESLSDKEKIAMLTKQLDIAYRKNATMVRKNKSLRLQLHSANKKPMPMKAKQLAAREILSPFFTSAQIDCFFRPDWFRSRNWEEEDFTIAISLRKLMSKKAFSYLRKKRLIPMPSLTSLRKYNKMNGIVLHQSIAPRRSSSTRKVGGRGKSSAMNAKLKKAAKMVKEENQKEVPASHPQILQYEQISRVGSNNTQYIVVDDPQVPDVNHAQFVTLSDDIIQQVGPNVEFIQQSSDEATGQIVTAILSPEVGNAAKATLQVVRIDANGLVQQSHLMS